MFCCLIAIGGLGFAHGKGVEMAIGVSKNFRSSSFPYRRVLLPDSVQKRVSFKSNVVSELLKPLLALPSYQVYTDSVIFADPIGHFDTDQYDHYRTRLLSYCSRNTIREVEVQDNHHRSLCVQPHWNFQQFPYTPHAFPSL